jgi:hypothetical protein
VLNQYHLKHFHHDWILQLHPLPSPPRVEISNHQNTFDNNRAIPMFQFLSVARLALKGLGRCLSSSDGIFNSEPGILTLFIFVVRDKTLSLSSGRNSSVFNFDVVESFNGCIFFSKLAIVFSRRLSRLSKRCGILLGGRFSLQDCLVCFLAMLLLNRVYMKMRDNKGRATTATEAEREFA